MTDRLPRSALALAGGLFAVAYGTNVSTPFLGRYQDRLDLGPSATMAIFVVYVAGILSTLLIAGPLSDRFGRRPVVVPMIVVAGLASAVLIPGRDDFGLLLLGRFLLGVASGGALGVGSAWMLELVGRGAEQRAAVITTIVSFGGFGMGPLVSAGFEWMESRFDLAQGSALVWPFVLHAGMAALAAAAMRTVPETHPADPTHLVRVRLGVPATARRAFLVVVLPAAIWVFAFPSAGFALFPVLVKESIAQSESGLFRDGGVSDVMVAAAAGALTAWAGMLARPLVARLGPRLALPTGMALGSLGYVFGTVAFLSADWETDLWTLVLIAAPLFGAASGALTAGCLTYLGTMADDAGRGALTSTFYLLAYPGMAMPLFITTVASLSSMDVALAVVTLAATAFTLIVAGSARRPEAASALRGRAQP